MSFLFPSWETAFSEGFHDDAKAMLEGALNKGNKPPVIQGRIEVVELSMGTQPPTLTLLEIGDLSLDRFRGIFRLGYQGDAWLEVRCRVQANPLSHNPHLAPNSTLPLSTPLLASQPLLVPMTLRLSLIHLRAILILVVSATKGITLVFKNDPLQNVDVSSTFDSVEVIRGYLQQEIEGQLREMFREDLPGIIHRLSQRWFMGGGVGGKVETPYVDEQRASSAQSTPSKHNQGTYENPDDPDAERDIFPPYHPPTSPAAITTPKRRASQRSTRPRRLSAASESPTSYTVFPDIEDYDPTYGLRPEGLPTHSGYEAFGRLWEKAREGEGRGLGGIMGVDVNDVIREESEESDWDGREADDVEDADEPGNESLDMVELEESLIPLGLSGSTRPGMSRQQSRRTSRHEENLVEYETIPAVGGGTITRPRVYHSQSRIRAPSEIGTGGNPALPSPSGSITARASSVGGGSTIGIGTGGRPGLPKSMTMSGLNTPLKPLGRNGTAPPSPAITNGPMRGRRGTSVSGLALPGPGPSSLRRSALVQNRQDVFSPNRAAPASHSHPRRTQSSQGIPRTATTSSSAARTSMGSSHDGPSRSNTYSTLASSQIPSRSMSISGSKSSPPRAPAHSRNLSTSFSQAGGSFPPRGAGLSGITLPLNNSVSQLATLSHSNHTLSPYARGHEHIAVRSFPHLGRTATNGALGPGAMTPAWASYGGPSHGQGDESVKMRAKRKRIFRLGSKDGKKAIEAAPAPDDVDDSFSPASHSPEEHPSRRSSADSKDVWRPASRPSSVIGLGLRTRPPAIGRSDSMASYGFPVVGSRRGSIYGRLAD